MRNSRSTRAARKWHGRKRRPRTGKAGGCKGTKAATSAERGSPPRSITVCRGEPAEFRPRAAFLSGFAEECEEREYPTRAGLDTYHQGNNGCHTTAQAILAETLPLQAQYSARPRGLYTHGSVRS